MGIIKDLFVTPKMIGAWGEREIVNKLKLINPFGKKWKNTEKHIYPERRWKHSGNRCRIYNNKGIICNRKQKLFWVYFWKRKQPKLDGYAICGKNMVRKK